MKILQIIEFFTPSMGGSVQICFQMAQNLAQRGHSVTVCTSDYAGRQYEVQDLPFEVKYFRSLPTRWKFYITPGLVSWAARHIREFDVIHMHNVRTFQNAVIAAYARSACIPYIVSPHGSLPYLGTFELFKKEFDLLAGRRLLSEAASLVAVSQYEEEQFISAGIAKEKIRLVPNGLNLTEFNNLPEKGRFRLRLGIRPETSLVFFLGRIHQIKGLDFLIEGFQEFHRQVADAALVTAGPDDGYEKQLKDMTKARGLAGSVFFPGPLFGKERLAGYVDADVLVYPGRYEIFGLVPIEALLCGTPVIVTAGTAAGQIMQAAGAGGMIEFGNAQMLAQEIFETLTNAERSAARVAAGKAYVREHLDWGVIVRNLENLYGEAQANKVSPIAYPHGTAGFLE